MVYKRKIKTYLLTIMLMLFINQNSFGVAKTILTSAPQADALQNFNTLMSHIKKPYPKDYGGAYIDSKGCLNINVVGNNIGKYKKIVSGDNVIYHKVKFSLEELQNVAELLTKKIKELNINAIAIREDKNAVFVYITDLNKSHISKIRKAIKSNAIIFIKGGIPTY